MKIAFDMDEVLAEYVSTAAKFHNHHYGTKLKKSDFKSYDFWETWGGTLEQAIDKVEHFKKTPFYDEIKPVRGSKNAVSLLKNKHKHELIIITARDEAVRKRTEDWIKIHFPNAFSGIHFVSHFTKAGTPIPKFEVCLKNKVDLIIEDSYKNATLCVNAGIPAILITRPWNKHEKIIPNMYRAKTWPNVLQKVVGLDSKR